MMSWKLSLLFFSAVTLHGCLSDTAELEVQDKTCIRKIVALYNKREEGLYSYKSYDPVPCVPLEGEEDDKAYIIKETQCLKSQNSNLSQCDSKPDGDVKICDCDADDDDPEDMMCVRVPTVTSVPKEKRSKRGIKRWLKLAKKYKKTLFKAAVAIADLFT